MVVNTSNQTPSQSGGTLNPASLTTVTGTTFHADFTGKTATSGESIEEFIVSNYSGASLTNQSWFKIGTVPTSATSGLTGTTLTSPIGDYSNQNWYNIYTNGTNAVYSYLFSYSGSSFIVTKFTYTGTTNSNYDNLSVAVLRSRGSYVQEVLTHRVTGTSAVTLTDVSGVGTNPLVDFQLDVTDINNTGYTFLVSFDKTSNKYINKVLGTSVFDKDKTEFPLYVHEVYPNFIESAFSQGYIRGLNLTDVVVTEGDNFLGAWDTPSSPVVVSEVRGNKVDELFEVITISDGESANTEVKITIQNINLETGDFDILVRDFNDTDDNVVVLERFSRCSMNPDATGYIARKIGTSDGDYPLNSKFIMLRMIDNAPSNAIPAGFKGFVRSGTTLGNVIYKTQIFESGDVMYYNPNGEPVLNSGGDKFKRISLGLSTQTGFKFDSDLLKWKGTSATSETNGFHLSKNASSIVSTTYSCTPYDLEGTDKGMLSNINFRKFTFAVCGGRDGWDIYRNVKTYGDEYIFGKKTYISGQTTNGGVFSNTTGNSDYYAYLDGVFTFENPEAVNINVFATPGINFNDHSSLTINTIEMIENERADSIYIINSPGPTTIQTADGVTEALDLVGIDSNYSATYWPWIQIRDTDNATQLYIPPTAEVVRNIALTDNVSYPWFAVAGYSRGLVNAKKAYIKLKQDDRDLLYKNRINPIATFSDTGAIIWGNKTLQVRESALDRMNVRRLLLRARKLISAVAVRLLFDQDDERVKQDFERLVNPILESIKRERGLNDFRVQVSNDTEDLDDNTLKGRIYIKPTRSLEFIDVEFVITPSGASFDNI
jgi:hypothetical protein